MGRYVVASIFSQKKVEKGLFFLSSFFFILGILLGVISTKKHILIPIGNETEKYFLSTFIFILTTNLIVAFVISVLGFLTGGLLSVIVLFFNGLKIGELFHVETGNIMIVVYYIIGHGVLEVFAFILFSMIGLAGFRFYYHLYKEGYPRACIPNFSLFIFPTVLLFIAAIIEAISICYII